jgi:mRNA interferase RelE/StbE
VSLRIDYDERAISQAAEFLDDPHGIRAVLDAIDRLADDPRPAGSFPYGSPDLRRLRSAGTGFCTRSRRAADPGVKASLSR